MFDRDGLRGLVVEYPSGNRATVSDGVLHVTNAAGWVRTERSEFKTFVLKFDARAVRSGKTALLAIFGTSPKGSAEGTAYVVGLFGRAVPDRKALLHMVLMALPQNPADVAAALRPADQWQAYQIVRTESRIVVSLNGKVVVDQEGPRTLDGWIGFLVQDDVEFRNARISAAPSEPPSGIYRPGPDVSLPRLLHEQKPNYTAEALAARIEGHVLLECVVGPDEIVSRAVVVRSLDQELGLDKEAIIAARKWRFEPGLRMGTPVPVLVTIDLTFSIRK